MTHVDTLNTGSSAIGGAGIISYAGGLPVTSAYGDGPGIMTHVDTLGGGSSGAGPASSYAPSSYTPTGASAASISADGVAFTLETGDISGLVQDMSAGGSLRLTGSIDSISYN